MRRLKSAKKDVSNEWHYLRADIDSIMAMIPKVVKDSDDELLPHLGGLKKSRDTYDGLLKSGEYLDPRQRDQMSQLIGPAIEIYEQRLEDQDELEDTLSAESSE